VDLFLKASMAQVSSLKNRARGNARVPMRQQHKAPESIFRGLNSINVTQ